MVWAGVIVTPRRLRSGPRVREGIASVVTGVLITGIVSFIAPYVADTLMCECAPVGCTVECKLSDEILIALSMDDKRSCVAEVVILYELGSSPELLNGNRVGVEEILNETDVLILELNKEDEIGMEERLIGIDPAVDEMLFVQDGSIDVEG